MEPGIDSRHGARCAFQTRYASGTRRHDVSSPGGNDGRTRPQSPPADRIDGRPGSPHPVDFCLSARVPFAHAPAAFLEIDTPALDRKSTRLNSSHITISYAVFCLKT